MRRVKINDTIHTVVAEVEVWDAPEYMDLKIVMDNNGRTEWHTLPTGWWKYRSQYVIPLKLHGNIYEQR